jgi:hypothetical protein
VYRVSFFASAAFLASRFLDIPPCPAKHLQMMQDAGFERFFA